MKKSTIISGAIFLIIGLITSCSKNEVVPTTSVIDIVNESALRTPPVIRV